MMTVRTVWVTNAVPKPHKSTSWMSDELLVAAMTIPRMIPPIALMLRRMLFANVCTCVRAANW